MIDITDKKLCCGCNACADACHADAISFDTDNEGFWYPKVDTQRCTNCGLCEKVCPIINVSALKKNDLEQSECYVAVNKNLDVVFDSTSGGIFSVLAEAVYKEKGFVGGAVFTEDFSVKHYISNVPEDLNQIRSSKYLQSNLSGFYRQVKGLVTQGEKVLVCGSPCQMAALRAYLRKDYPNLLIVDYICRGINSPKVWHKYLDSFEERYGSKVIYCKAKSKEFGWRKLTQKVILANGRHCYETRDQSNYMKGYLRTGVFCRPSCYECRFKGFPRMADITLADFWGIEKIDKTLDKYLGNSLVMLNSQKGKMFFEQLKDDIDSIQVPFSSIEAGNRSLRLSVPPSKVDRQQFFSDLDKMSFDELSRKYIQQKETRKQWAKRELKYVTDICRATQLRPKPLFQFLRLNSLREILRGDVIVPTPHTIIDFAKGSHIIKHGMSVIGGKKFMGAHLETRLLVERGATLQFDGPTSIAYGAHIEVREGATLRFGGYGSTNIGAIISCAERIDIGAHVRFGRNITVIDNNEGHHSNKPDLLRNGPVIIGEKCWLCESCTIMPDVRIGDGAVIGAQAIVTADIPGHTLSVGSPAKVIKHDVLWKY